MKKWLASLVIAAIAGVSLAAPLSYQVFDVRVHGKTVDVNSKERYIIGPGSLRGFLVFEERSGNATFIGYEKGSYLQDECLVEIYTYANAFSEEDSGARESGIAEIWFDIFQGDLNIWGSTLGKYTLTSYYATHTSNFRITAKGTGQVLAGESFGGYIRSVVIRQNRKLTEKINAAEDAQIFMEQVVAAKSKVSEVDFNWGWTTGGE